MIHVSYAEIDEQEVRKAISEASKRLNIRIDLYSLSSQTDKDSFFDKQVFPSVEAASYLIFFYSKAGSSDPFLRNQFKMASDLNKPIIPVIIESNNLNLGMLKVKSPFPFRTQPLNYYDENDRIRLIEQLHSAYGLMKRGDVYGACVNIISDSDVNVLRIDEILGRAEKDKPFRINLSKGKHRITFKSVDTVDAEWVEYTVTVLDNDMEFEIHPRLQDVRYVRDNKIKDLMYDPDIPEALDWDKLSDTETFKLLRSSQDYKKRDVAIASFYRKYIEDLEPKPKLTYTDFSPLPKEYVLTVCAILTVVIWGKALIWLLSFVLYLCTFGHVNWAGRTWDWLWFDTNFWPIAWAIAIWLAYVIITAIIEFVIDKRDEIRNSLEIHRVTSYNEKLFNRLNNKQNDYLQSRGWKLKDLQQIDGPYPATRLTFNYFFLPDNHANYNKKSRQELTFPDNAVPTESIRKRIKSFSWSKVLLTIIPCALLITKIVMNMNRSEEETHESGQMAVVNQENGNFTCVLPNGLNFSMVYVEGGGYRMGNTSAQAWRYEKPVHNVFLKDFYIGKLEVTQALWTEVMGTNPSSNKSSLENPVESVSWDDCQAFIRELNKKTGQDFRLPTEAEWEYAARGGKKGRNTKYSGSSILADVGWYKDNSSNTTSRVGQLSSNELGIFDMTGNVAEWVSDYYDYYPKEDQHDPIGPEKGKKKVYRGGAYASGLELSRLTIRAGLEPGKRHKTIGLRLAKDKK